MTYSEVVEITEQYKISKIKEAIEILIKFRASQGLNSLDFCHDTVGFNEDLYRYTVRYFRDLGFKVNEQPISYEEGFYIEWD